MLKSNNLVFCTITGADDATDPSELDDISEEFPFLEVAVLLSKESDSPRPRFPSKNWRLKFQRTYLGARSFHFCGKYLLDVLNESSTLLDRLTDKLGIWRSAATRVQLNLSTDLAFNQTYNIRRFAEDLPRNEPVILQLREDNTQLISLNLGSPLFDSIPNVNNRFHFLVDESGGTGKPILNFPRIGGVFLGYAGGLGPHNIEDTILKINAGGPCNYWIDMESGVRTDDELRLDMNKVHAVLKTINLMKKDGLA